LYELQGVGVIGEAGTLAVFYNAVLASTDGQKRVSSKMKDGTIYGNSIK
jgi:hypothetical protein